MWPAVTLFILRLRQLVLKMPLSILALLTLLALVAEYKFSSHYWCAK
jgi:hypothetical protein